MNSSFGTGGNNSTSNPNNSSNVVSTPRSSRFNNAAAAAEPNDGIDGDGGDTGRGRSHTDPAHLLNIKYAIEEMADPTHPYKQRLYQLFSLIEREMEALHLENSTLRARLEIQSGGGDRMMGNEAETPLRRDFTAQLNETFQSLGMGSNGFEHKSAKKSTQSRQQKWKSAFKNPSGKLALKVGANFPESKHKFVQSFKGHTDGVWHVCTAQLPDGAHVLASASADQTVKIWLSGSGAQPLASYSGHAGSVNSVAIRPEGAAGAYSSAGMYGSQLTMLTCSGDRTAHIWRLNIDQISERRREAGTENDEPQFVQPVLQPLLKLNGHSDPVMAGDWLYGGQQIITVSWDRTANLFDAESGKVLKTLSGHDQELTSCSAHPSQKLLATASRDYTFRLWDFREPIHSVAVFQGHNDSVTSVVFSTLHHIVSGSDDRTVKVWDLRNMRSPTSAIRLDSAANRIAICNSKNLLAIPLDNRNISIYDLNGNRQARIPRSTGKCHHRLVSACAWLSDHPLNNLITCGFDKQIIGWRVQLPGSAGAKS